MGTDVSAKYRGAFCEAKIKTAKRLVKVKVRDFPVNMLLLLLGGEGGGEVICVQNTPSLGAWQCSYYVNNKLVVVVGVGGVPPTLLPTQLNTSCFFHCFVIRLPPLSVAFSAIG